jgi:hypothetical protein
MTEQTGTFDADMAAFGMTMPPDFPRATYLKIELHCRPRISPDGPQKPAWDQYAFAWNAKLREIPLNDRATLSRRQWLASTLDGILRDAETFVVGVLP